MRKQEGAGDRPDISCLTSSLVCLCWRDAASCLKSSLAGERVPGVYANPGPTTLTPPGHDLEEESSTSNPTRFNSRDLESKGETMLVTNEPLSAPHLPHGHRTYGGTDNNLINATLRGNPRAVKYLIEDRVSNPSPPLVFEGCENLAFDGSYGQDNPGFDTNLSYLPFGDSRSLDPGYGSEKSEEEGKGEEEEEEEEDEDSDSSSDEESNLRHSFLEPPQGIRLDVEYLMKIFPFINEATMFDVTIVKNSRGLGLAVTGGVECESGVLPGLIRIRKLYPQTPAWLCGQLQVNDFILEANGMQLTGLTSHEALEVLRTAGREVHLVLCRAPEEVLNASEESSPTETKECGVVTTSLTAPQPILGGHFLSPSPSFSTCGEFEIHLRKVSGSLGFTLRKNDNSILGHTIRSLVKEPAISDGRLKPGDKLVSVNGTDMCGLSHEEAVQFLRTCPESVVIRIYRDAMQTPVSPASPTEPEFLKPKALRQEARDMLTDLAFRKQSLHHLANNPHAEVPATPRRRRLNKNSSPDSKEERWESLVREAEASSRNTNDAIDSREVSPFDNSHSNTLTAVSSQSETSGSRSSSGNSYNELSVMNLSQSPANSSCSEHRPKRPNFLDLNSSHSSSKKSQFTPPHEEFPSPPAGGRQFDSLDSAPQLTSTHSDTPAFSHLQTAYRSVNAVSSLSPFAEQRLTNTSSDHNISSHAQGSDSPHKKNALLKWKGVVFTPEEEEAESKEENDFITDFLHISDLSASHESQVVTLELTRGWNSRLGFSLQNNGDDTVIVAIYAESVAAKDGRLRIGDLILEVNGNDVRSSDSQSVIELLRKTRGKICLKILRKET